MNMRSGCGAGNCMPEGDKGYAAFFQIFHYGLALGTVRLDRNVNPVAVIKTHFFMGSRLTVSADGQWPPKTLLKECLKIGSFADHPGAAAVISNKSRSRLVRSNFWRR